MSTRPLSNVWPAGGDASRPEVDNTSVAPGIGACIPDPESDHQYFAVTNELGAISKKCGERGRSRRRELRELPQAEPRSPRKSISSLTKCSTVSRAHDPTVLCTNGTSLGEGPPTPVRRNV